MSSEAVLRPIPTWLLVVIVPAVAVIAVIVTNFVSSDQNSATTGSATVPNTVVIKNFSFSPNALDIQPGEKVVWKVESGTHTVTADDNAFDSGDMNSTSQPFEQIFATAGEITYHCNHHAAMKGK